MINKAANILVTLVLLLGTSGMSITKHYCGNDLIGTTVISAPKDCCGNNCGRCHDEVIKIKISDQFLSSHLNADLRAGFTLLSGKQILTVVTLSPDPFSVGTLPATNGSPPCRPESGSHVWSGTTPSFLQVFLI